MAKKSKTKLILNQQGITSIVVAVVLMLVMSLIVLAMSQNTQREQRQTLDRQLSDQAFYNAESGINDVAAYLYSTPTANLDKTDCNQPLGTINSNIDGEVNKYTCVLYDKAPPTIQYDNLSITEPKIIPINPVDQNGAPAQLSSLTVSWDDSAERNGTIAAPCNFTAGSPDLPTSCSYGGVRFELVGPTAVNPAVPDREEFRRNTLIAFLLPNSSAGTNISVSSVNYPDNQGIINPTNCSNTSDTTKRRCTMTLTDINRGEMFLSLRALYRPVNISISGTSTTGAAIRFKDTQIMVDSTGKANDILRRVQVRLPANNQSFYPGFALQTRDSICKIINVTKDSSGVGSASSANPSLCPTN